jgi:hypothetical protein
MPTEDGEMLPPPPPELLDYLRRIEASGNNPDDVREAARVLRESVETRHLPPQGIAYGSWTFTGTAEGHAPPIDSGSLQGEARVKLKAHGDLVNAREDVAKVTQPEIKSYLDRTLNLGTSAIQMTSAIARLIEQFGGS